MSLSFQPVTLGLGFGDDDAVLAYHDAILVAVLSRLGDLHGESAGKWHLEATFLPNVGLADRCFADLGQFEDWIACEPTRS